MRTRDSRSAEMRWSGARIVSLSVLALAVLAVGILITRSSGSYEVTAVFDQANGLVKGGEVEVAGQAVGKVEHIDLGKDGYPHVRLKIDDDYRLRRGAVADLRFYSVSGSVNRYVALAQGRGPELADHATLGQAGTDQPEEIDQVLDTLSPATRDDVRAVLAGLDRGTVGRGAQIEATLAHSAQALHQTAGLVQEVDSDGRSLRQFTEKGRRMVGLLADNHDALGSTASNLAAVLQVTAARQRELSLALARLPAGLRWPRVALDRADASVPDLRALVAASRPAARQLVPVSRELRPVLAAARPTLRQASALAGEAPTRLAQLRSLLPTATTSLKTLGPALEQANPMLDQARARAPDFFSFFSNWADFTSNYDANGNAARVGLVADPAPLNPIGPNDTGAGSMRPPYLRTPGVLEGEPWTDYRKSFVGSGG